MTKKHLIFLLLGLILFALVFCAVAGCFEKSSPTVPSEDTSKTETQTETQNGGGSQNATQDKDTTDNANGAVASSFARELRLTDPMMTGDDVASIQEILKNEGHYVAWEVDGIFGEVTQQAVMDYQLKHGICSASDPNYGVVDRITWDSIMKTGGKM